MKIPAINTIGQDKCAGCSACAAVCPVNAIKMVENKNGFLEPKVDLKICNQCGICNKICPVISFKNCNENNPDCYAGWSTNSENILKSSSGGIFFEMAKNIIKNNGMVAGVVMNNKRPIHKLSNNINVIEDMRGSKYLQSNTLKVFQEIIKLKDNKKTLFVGTPCQVAALKNIYEFYHKNTKNLITCEIICHGVPSYKIFDEYLKTISKTTLKNVSFRDKTFGWKNYSIKIDFNNSNKITPQKKDLFMKTFLSDIGLRESCYNCPFQQIPRIGDITLGDFWGVPKELKNKNGTSAIIVNSEKGRELIEKLKRDKKISTKKTTLPTIYCNNPRLISGYVERPNIREEFFEIFDSKGFDFAYKKIIEPTMMKKKLLSKIKGIKRIFNISYNKKSNCHTKSKIALLHIPNTLNYGSMMMAENVMHYLSERIENPSYVIISNKKEETYSRLSKATGIKNIEIRDLPSLNSKFKMYWGFFNNYAKTFLNPKSVEIVKILKDCNHILILGGDDLSEYYGISGLLKSLRDIYTLSVSGKKVYLLGQTIGPFNSWRISLVKKILGMAESIYLRDKKSYDYCKNTLQLKNLSLSTDLAFLDLNRQKELVNLKSYGLVKGKYFCIVPSGLWFKYCNDYERYIKGLTKMINNALNIAKSKNYKIVLLAHVLKPDKVDDRRVINDIAQKINDSSLIVINNTLLPFEARSILASSKLVISGRMHSAISAFQTGVPAISLSYSVKYAGVIGNSLDLPELIIETKNNTFLEDITKVDNLIIKIMKDYKSYKTKIKKSIIKVRKDALNQVESIAKSINTN